MSETKSNKKYYEQLDVVYLAKEFSKFFHHNSITPEFYINQFRQNRYIWDVFPTEDPIKTVQEFLPHSHLNHKSKINLYSKAERANQHLAISEVFSHFLFRRQSEVHYNQDPIKQISLQWIVVTGHRNHKLIEDEENFMGKLTFLLKDKQPICLIHLETESGKTFYLDLCATQIDIYSYSEDGFPFLMIEEEIKIDQLYSETHNLNVKVLEVEQLVPINSETNYGAYLEMLVDQQAEDSDPDRAEFLVEFHERLEEDFRKLIYAKINAQKKKEAKKRKKAEKKVTET